MSMALLFDGSLIVLILATSVVWSLLKPKKAKHVVPNPDPGVLKSKPLEP